MDIKSISVTELGNLLAQDFVGWTNVFCFNEYKSPVNTELNAYFVENGDLHVHNYYGTDKDAYLKEGVTLSAYGIALSSQKLAGGSEKKFDYTWEDFDSTLPGTFSEDFCKLIELVIPAYRKLIFSKETPLVITDKYFACILPQKNIFSGEKKDTIVFTSATYGNRRIIRVDGIRIMASTSDEKLSFSGSKVPNFSFESAS